MSKTHLPKRDFDTLLRKARNADSVNSDYMGIKLQGNERLLRMRYSPVGAKHPGFTAAKKRYLIKDEKKAAKEYISLGFPRIAKDERRHARIIKGTKVR